MKIIRTVTLGLVLSLSAVAVEAREALVNGQDGQTVTPDQVVNRLQPGAIVIVSEQHDFVPHHENQVTFLNALAAKGSKISVGMEFLQREHQAIVDDFLAGKIPEENFLKQVEWGSPSFDLYRNQVLFPYDHQGRTVALNAPRWLTGKIARSGLDSLTKEERDLLPADFQLGNAGYKERFRQVMAGHGISEEQLDRYFAAQSAWDEVMSETACQFVTTNPDQVLMIIVGDFHAQYGGGLPDRLKARGCQNVTVVSQTVVAELGDPTKNADILPDAQWGPRGDYVWAVEDKKATIFRSSLQWDLLLKLQ